MNYITTLIAALSLLLPLFTTSCPVYVYTCKGIDTSPVFNCWNHRVQCRNSTRYIQFQGIGQFYKVTNVKFPENTLKVVDPYLFSKLNVDDEHLNCDFLYNFTDPLLGFYPSMALNFLPNLTMFNCLANSYDFSRDVFQKYDYSHCRGFELYYSFHPERLNLDDQNCLSEGQHVVEWEWAFNLNSVADTIDFSILSVAFTHRRAAKPECFGCMMKEGGCSAVAAGSSNCSCNLKCSRTGQNRGRNTILMACSAFLVGFVVFIIIAYHYRRRKMDKDNSSQPSFEAILVAQGPLPVTRYSYKEL